MNNYEFDYLNLLLDALENGTKSNNRTDTPTRKLWGRQLNIDLSKGFPAMTSKRLHWKSIVHELLWMISGDTNIQYLLKNGVTFWTEWPYKEYLKFYEKTGMQICVDGGTIYGVNDGARSNRPFTQKEFEQRIITNNNFSNQFGSIGKYGYGAMWRRFPARKWQYGADMSYEEDNIEIDQLSNAINDLKTNPNSRRIIISAWHPYHSNNLSDALLPACHNYIQFGTEDLSGDERNYLYIGKMKGGWAGMVKKDYDAANIPSHRLNCYFSMRSSDIFLGLPYNCAFYGLFTHLLANHLNMVPSKLVYSAADVHLYENHTDQARTQLERRTSFTELPTLKINTPGKSIFDIKFEDIELVGYNPLSTIKAEVAV
jgi:thymidylate synthase